MLIVDVNVCPDVFAQQPHADFVPILEAVLTGKAKVVLGGDQLKAEYQRLGAVWKFFIGLDRAGRTKLVDDTAVNTEAETISTTIALESNDAHILALARISGARLLCSRDQPLHADFLNPKVISKPRGSVYQNAAHVGLIRKHCR